MKLLYFSSKTCVPCRVVKVIMERLKHAHRVDVDFLDVNKDIALAQKYRVMSVPTVIAIDGDHIKEKLEGVRTPDDYLKMLD